MISWAESSRPSSPVGSNGRFSVYPQSPRKTSAYHHCGSARQAAPSARISFPRRCSLRRRSGSEHTGGALSISRGRFREAAEFFVARLLKLFAQSRPQRYDAAPGTWPHRQRRTQSARLVYCSARTTRGNSMSRTSYPENGCPEIGIESWSKQLIETANLSRSASSRREALEALRKWRHLYGGLSASIAVECQSLATRLREPIPSPRKVTSEISV